MDENYTFDAANPIVGGTLEDLDARQDARPQTRVSELNTTGQEQELRQRRNVHVALQAPRNSSSASA